MKQKGSTLSQSKGFAQILVIIILLVLIAAAFFVIKRGATPTAPNPLTGRTTTTQEQAETSQPQIPAVNSPQDLTTVSNDLDNTSLGDLNTQLNQNDADASNF